MSAPTIIYLSAPQQTSARASAMGLPVVDELSNDQTIQAGRLHLIRGVSGTGRTHAACVAALTALVDEEGTVLYACGNDDPAQVAKKLKAMAKSVSVPSGEGTVGVHVPLSELPRIKVARTRTVAELIQFIGNEQYSGEPFLLIIDDLPLMDWIEHIEPGTGQVPSVSPQDDTREQQLSWFTRFLSKVAEGANAGHAGVQMGISAGSYAVEGKPMAVLVTAQSSQRAKDGTGSRWEIPGGDTLVNWSHLIVDLDHTSGPHKRATVTKSPWGSMR